MLQPISINNNYITSQSNNKCHNKLLTFGCLLMPKGKLSQKIENAYSQQVQSLIRNSNQILQRKNAIVRFPGVDNSTVIVKDIYPIAVPHLLVVHPQNPILSLAEISKNKSFLITLKEIANKLKRMFPEQEILFFEHGSGTMKNNWEDFIKLAGESIMLAHGHFCVLPKSANEAYSKVITETCSALEQNKWNNLAKSTYQSSRFFPNFEEITSALGKKSDDIPPYILCSRLGDGKNAERSTLFIEEGQPKTPGQLLRKIIAQFVFGSSEITNWNWRKLLKKLNRGEDISDYSAHLKLLKQQDDIFEEQLQNISKSI